MKLLMALLVLSTTSAFAKTKFTEGDFYGYVRNGAMKVKVAKTAQPALVAFGPACARAALAVVINKEIEKAMEDGVDLPESMDVLNASVSRPTPSVNLISIRTYDTTTRVMVYPSSIPCTAERAR